ncbi:MAG: transporter substrate-binding domain-containing protein [bacterium]|nr:transporter substrate-binding domain-containing protein [bacterium]
MKRSSLLLVALALCGCAGLIDGWPARSGDGRPAATGATYLQRVLEAGELRVGTSADLPPLTMHDKRGELIGLEVDLARALGDAMGLQVRFIEKPFAELLPTLARGDVDMVVSGLTMTPERNARFAFAGPYFISGTSILSKSLEIASTMDPAALDDPERIYVALEGSTSARLVADRMSKSRLVTAPDYQAGIRMVIEGQAHALVADFQVCNLARWRNPDAGLHSMATPFTTEPLGIALPPNAPLLLNLVSNYLNTLEATGMLAQLKAKWLSDGSWTAELP